MHGHAGVGELQLYSQCFCYLFLNGLNPLILLYIFTTVYIFVGYFINVFLDSVHLFSITNSILVHDPLACIYVSLSLPIALPSVSTVFVGTPSSPSFAW